MDQNIVDIESQNSRVDKNKRLTVKSFDFQSSFFADSDDSGSLFIDQEGNSRKGSRASSIIKGLFDNKRGSIFIEAQHRITKLIQDRVTKKTEEKRTQFKVLEDKYRK